MLLIYYQSRSMHQTSLILIINTEKFDRHFDSIINLKIKFYFVFIFRIQNSLELILNRDQNYYIIKIFFFSLRSQGIVCKKTFANFYCMNNQNFHQKCIFLDSWFYTGCTLFTLIFFSDKCTVFLELSIQLIVITFSLLYCFV